MRRAYRIWSRTSGQRIILWHSEPANEVRDNSRERRKDRSEKPQNPDEGDIQVEVPGNTGTNAGDLSPLVRTAQARPLLMRILSRLRALPCCTACRTVSCDVFQFLSTLSAVHRSSLRLLKRMRRRKGSTHERSECEPDRAKQVINGKQNTARGRCSSTSVKPAGTRHKR
jgi:hypothetical protein